MTGGNTSPTRVMIYRLGALGDTLLALPVLKLIRTSFPGAAFALLTIHREVSDISMPEILRPLGLSGTVITYNQKERSPRALLTLRRRIREFAPDVLVYAAEPRGLIQVWRDYIFFRACGVPKIIGAPVTPEMIRHHHDEVTGLWESERHRLARALSVLGEVDDTTDLDPELTPDELAEADRLLAAWPGASDYIAMCESLA